MTEPTEADTWTPPPEGTLIIPGEDVARTADGDLVFTHDPFRLRSLTQPQAPQPQP